ncbi:nucleotidyltransferase domain-containing protein [Gelria sp. Kuro-4]|uniref:nucleotidyltransferase domain-containing protein n=1 Tax=Gelria sp. Kuro-4 TaxID=2796927 RepID=UPI001BF03A01|nr:hypothetical protein kuro4_11610 [Gelria sp. Kuro-4]
MSFVKKHLGGNLPHEWRDGVQRFVSRVKDRFSPCCTILYGSVAKGAYTVESNIDVIVIAEGLARARLLCRAPGNAAW